VLPLAGVGSKLFWDYQVSKPGLVNPNWSLGRNLENLPKKINSLSRNTPKTLKKYTQNIEKSMILNSSLGRRNFFLSCMRPVGTCSAIVALRFGRASTQPSLFTYLYNSSSYAGNFSDFSF
jgi:hypothetical protein